MATGQPDILTPLAVYTDASPGISDQTRTQSQIHLSMAAQDRTSHNSADVLTRTRSPGKVTPDWHLSDHTWYYRIVTTQLETDQ